MFFPPFIQKTEPWKIPCQHEKCQDMIALINDSFDKSGPGISL